VVIYCWQNVILAPLKGSVAANFNPPPPPQSSHSRGPARVVVFRESLHRAGVDDRMHALRFILAPRVHGCQKLISI